MASIQFFEDAEIGDEIGPIPERISTERVKRFLNLRPRLAGDGRFQNHDDARRMGLAGMIVPGPMTAGILAKMLHDWAPGGRLIKLDLVFRRNVLHDAPILLHGLVTDLEERDQEPVIDLDLFLTNADDERLITGNASLALPSRGA